MSSESHEHSDSDDLDELQSALEGVVGERPAATLMRHLSPSEWPDVATRADLAELATKADLAELRSEMATKADLAELRSEMATKAELAEVRSEMATKADLAELRTETKSGIRELEHKVETGLLSMQASLVERMNQNTIAMIFALVTVVLILSGVSLLR